MEYYAGIDVSLEESGVCVMDGRIVCCTVAKAPRCGAQTLGRIADTPVAPVFDLNTISLRQNAGRIRL